MNRRNFFKTVGIPALALPFVKRLGLPKPKDFQSLQIIKSVKWGISDDFTRRCLWYRTHLVCPHCNYGGDYIHLATIHDDLIPEIQDENVKINWFFRGKYQTLKPCPKCNRNFEFIVSENCKFMGNPIYNALNLG